MSKILITGGAGFIGAHTAKKLMERGDEVIIIDDFNDYYNPELKEDRLKFLLANLEPKVYRADIRNLEDLKKVFKENKIDKVCHLAARAGVRASLKNPPLSSTPGPI